MEANIRLTEPCPGPVLFLSIGKHQLEHLSNQFLLFPPMSCFLWVLMRQRRLGGSPCPCHGVIGYGAGAALKAQPSAWKVERVLVPTAELLMPSEKAGVITTTNITTYLRIHLLIFMHIFKSSVCSKKHPMLLGFGDF